MRSTQEGLITLVPLLTRGVAFSKTPLLLWTYFFPTMKVGPVQKTTDTFHCFRSQPRALPSSATAWRESQQSSPSACSLPFRNFYLTQDKKQNLPSMWAEPTWSRISTMLIASSHSSSLRCSVFPVWQCFPASLTPVSYLDHLIHLERDPLVHTLKCVTCVSQTPGDPFSVFSELIYELIKILFFTQNK